MADNDQRPECPICLKLGRKPAGKLMVLGPLLTCCGCQKMWTEPEFLGSVKEASLAYYFKDSIHGEIVIYDPTVESHKFIEEVANGQNNTCSS